MFTIGGSGRNRAPLVMERNRNALGTGTETIDKQINIAPYLIYLHVFENNIYI